jgi:hypothetical protein
MSVQAAGVPIQFNASIDANNFFVPVSEGITLPSLSSDFPLTAFKIKTVPQKDFIFNVTGSVEGFNIISSGATSLSGSVQLVKRSGTDTVLEQGIFTKLADEEITGGSGQFNFSTTSSLAFNDLVYLRVIGLRNTTSPQNPSAFTASLNSFKITSIPTGSAKELVVEPYFTSPFYGTDCDVMYGNASQPVINPFLQDIDYSSGTIVPTNNEAIINGSATKGTVPESFFTIKSILNPTYESINTTDRYNIDKSSYSSQISAGTFTAYYTDVQLGTSSGPTNSFARFTLSYIIDNNGETFEISNSDDDINFLKRLFGSNANPFKPVNSHSYPSPTDPVHIRAIPFIGSGSSASDEPASFNGRPLIQTFGSSVKLLVFNSGSSAVNIPQGGGIVFPADIELTSASDLPSKSRKILTEANILSPEGLD